MLSGSEGVSPALAEVGRRGPFHRLSPWPRISSPACPGPRHADLPRLLQVCWTMGGPGRGGRGRGKRSGVGSSGFLPMTVVSALRPSPDSDNTPFSLPGPLGPAWDRPPAAAGPQHFTLPVGPPPQTSVKTIAPSLRAWLKPDSCQDPLGAELVVASAPFTGLGDTNPPAWHHDRPHPSFSYRSWF